MLSSGETRAVRDTSRDMFRRGSIRLGSQSPPKEESLLHTRRVRATAIAIFAVLPLATTLSLSVAAPAATARYGLAVRHRAPAPVSDPAQFCYRRAYQKPLRIGGGYIGDVNSTRAGKYREHVTMPKVDGRGVNCDLYGTRIAYLGHQEKNRTIGRGGWAVINDRRFKTNSRVKVRDTVIVGRACDAQGRGQFDRPGVTVYWKPKKPMTRIPIKFFHGEKKNACTGH